MYKIYRMPPDIVQYLSARGHTNLQAGGWYIAKPDAKGSHVLPPANLIGWYRDQDEAARDCAAMNSR